MRREAFSKEAIEAISPEEVPLGTDATLFAFPNGIVEIFGHNGHRFLGQVCSFIKREGGEIGEIFRVSDHEILIVLVG